MQMRTTLVLAALTVAVPIALPASPASPWSEESAEPSLAVEAASSMESRTERAIRRAFNDVLDRDPTDRELRRYRDLMEDSGWSERDVREDLRRDSRGSRDRRDRMTRGEAERIVRRAYREVLDREPDRGGRAYVDKVLNEDWTAEDVERDLRKSPEYREVSREKAEEIVRNAYRAVLGREPDAGSWTYVNKVMKERWTQQQVERELRKSPEYRQKRR
jgi:hypothetical protein